MQVPYGLQSFWETRKKLIIGGGAFVVVVAVATVVGLLFSETSPMSPTTERIPTGRVTLVWWKPGLYGMQLSNYQKVINDFQNKYPNVTIQFVSKPYGTSYYRDIVDSMARGVGPDIFSLHNNDLPAYRKYLTPISVFNKPDETGVGRFARYRSNFVDLVTRETIFQGEVYGVTTYVDNLQMYVNKDLLNQAKIPIPAQTWDSLDIQIPKLTRVNTSGTGFSQSAISLGTGATTEPIPNIDRHQDILPLLMFQYGEQIYDPITSKVTFGGNRDNKKPALEALRFYYSFASPTSKRYTWSVNSPNNIEAFTSGKLAYIIHYSYFRDEIARRNPRLNYEVVPIPQVDPNNKKTYGFFFMDVLNRSLRDRPEQAAKLYWAEQFLLYLSSTEAQTTMAASTGFPSARKDVISKQLQGDLATQVFAEGALYADNYYKPDFGRTEKIWSDMMYSIHYRSNVRLEDALDAAVREYNALVLAGPQTR